MNTRGHLIGSAARLGGAAVTGQLLTALAAVVVARSGGAAGFGLVTVGLGLVAITSDVLDFGAGAYLGRELAAGRLMKVSALRLTWRRLRPFWAVSAAGVAVSAVWGGEQRAAVMLVALYLACTGPYLALSILARATEDFQWAARAAVIDRLLLLGLTSVGALMGRVVVGFVTGLCVGSIVAASICLSRLTRTPSTGVLEADLVDPLLRVRDLYRQSRALGLAGLATDLGVLEGPLVGLGAGQVAAGRYGAALRLAGPLGIPASSVAAVWLPRLARARHWTAVRTQFAHLVRLLVPLAGGLALVAVLARFLVPTVLGKDYGSETATAVQVICATAFVSSFNQLLYTVCIATKNEVMMQRCLMCLVPVGLALTWVGASLGGVVWATAGGLAAQIAISTFLGIAVVKRLRSDTAIGSLC